MPIYEYTCAACGRTSGFLVRNVTGHRRPACPHCGSRRTRRQMSRFAAVGAKKERLSMPAGAASAPPADGALAGSAPDLAGLESVMSGMDENDPRSMGRMMRTLSRQTGEPLEGEAEEVVRRLESGEDPEQIEEKMGDLSGPGGGGDELYDG